MGHLGARLFTWLQGATFYRRLHEDAVMLLPKGTGALWIDIGGGPGLMARLAAERGYDALGIDHDTAMTGVAERIADKQGSLARFETGDLFALPARSADVVSASSLLATLPDKRAGLKALLRVVRPGGTLLLIEPGASFTRAAAEAFITRHGPSRGMNGLRLWALMRGGRTIDPALFEELPAQTVTRIPLLDGLVTAWLIRS